MFCRKIIINLRRFLRTYACNLAKAVHERDQCMVFSDQYNPSNRLKTRLYTASKVSKLGIFTGPSFPGLGQNTQIYSVNLCIQSGYEKMQTRKTINSATFHVDSPLYICVFSP